MLLYSLVPLNGPSGPIKQYLLTYAFCHNNLENILVNSFSEKKFRIIIKLAVGLNLKLLYEVNRNVCN